jgi:hypothetical protein
MGAGSGARRPAEKSPAQGQSHRRRNTREKVLYRKEREQINGKKRSEAAKFLNAQGGGDGYFRKNTSIVRKFLRHDKNQNRTPDKKIS